MALLSDADRIEVWQEMMRNPIPGETWSLNRDDLRAFVDAIDAWWDANAASANAAIPQPARGALSIKQKAFGFQLLLAKRYQTGT